MDTKLWDRVAHLVDSKEVEQRSTCYKHVKFAVQKKAEINFEDAKRNSDSTSKPKATSHFHASFKKSNLPASHPGDEMPTPLPSEESDSGESYEAIQEG